MLIQDQSSEPSDIHNSPFFRRACGHVDQGTCPHQVLAATLTLSQPGGADYAHPILVFTPSFESHRRACLLGITVTQGSAHTTLLSSRTTLQSTLAKTVQAQQLESQNLSKKIKLFHNCLRLYSEFLVLAQVLSLINTDSPYWDNANNVISMNTTY